MNTSRRTLVHTPATTRPGSTTRKATSHRALVAGILATTALAFTACSGQGNEAATDPAIAENANAEGTAADATAAETTTITQTENGVSDKSSGNTPNPTGSAPDQGDDTTTAETGGTSTSSSESGDNGEGSGLRQDMTAEIYNNPSPGSTFMAAGEQATTCIYGDGYGLNLIAAGQTPAATLRRLYSTSRPRALTPRRTISATICSQTSRPRAPRPARPTTSAAAHRTTLSCAPAATTRRFTCTSAPGGGRQAVQLLAAGCNPPKETTTSAQSPAYSKNHDRFSLAPFRRDHFRHHVPPRH